MYLKRLSFALIAGLIILSSGCKKSNNNLIYGISDDMPYTVAVLMGSTHDDYMVKNYPDVKTLRFDSEPDMFVALDNDKVDIAILDYFVYALSSANKSKYRVLENIFDEHFGMGFNKNNTALRDQYNLFLAELRSSGQYDEIYKRWFDDYENASIPDLGPSPSGEVLKAGITGSTEGFAFIRNGEATGFDVELIKRFGHYLGRPVEFSYITFGGLITALNSGTVDIISSGMTVTPERSKMVAFSDIYYISKTIAIVKTERYAPEQQSGQKKRLESLSDISGLTAAVITGNLHDIYVTENYPSTNILRFDSYPDIIVSLDGGKSDVAFVEGAVYETSLKKTGKYEILEVIFEDPYGVGFRLNNTELRDQFNSFLKQIKADKTYDQIISRWIDNFERAEMPDLGAAPTGKPLKLGCTGTTDAFDYIKNGKNAGVDIEIIERFGRFIGRPIEYFNLNFGGLIAALNSGSVDMISSAMTITDERAKMVAFSDPYYISESMAIVLKERYGKDNKGTLYSSMDDIARKRIGVLMSSVQDQYISDTYPQADVLRIDLAPDLVLALKSGQCEAIVLPSPEIKEILRLNSDIAVLEDNIYSTEFGIGFKEKSLRDKFNTFLSDIRKDGTYDQMYKRWIDNSDNAEMPELNTPAGSTPLIVGTSAQSPPFTFIKNGVNSGFDIELVSRFAASLGRGVKFDIMTFGGLIPALNSGKIDVIASSAMMTDERRQQVNFSDPYFEVGSTVLVLRKKLSDKDLSVSRVGAMTGTTGEMHIQEFYPDAKISSFDDIMDAVAALKSGKVDYVITAYTTALRVARSNPSLQVLPEEYVQEPAVIGIQKSKTELLKSINRVLGQFKKDGTLDEIIQRWVKDDDSPYETVEIPKIQDGPLLRVAIAANREPMCFISNNKIVGLDCELIERIAYELGMKVEYSDMKFSALITAIEAGKADIVISNLTATEERRQKINFSDPYFVNPQVLLSVKSTPPAQEDKQGWFSGIKESFHNNLIKERRYMLILEGLKQTLIITLFAAILGTIIGGLICAMRMSRRKSLNIIAKGYISIMRGTPLLVLLMIFFYVVFASTGLSATIVAIFTFALNMAAYSSEMFRTSILGVDRGQKEAGVALGFTKVQTFIYIVLPQAVKSVLPVYKGEVISLLKMTSIVGYIAVVDLTKASDIIRSRTFDAFFPLIMVAVIYFLLAWLIGMGLDLLNKKTSSEQ